MSDARFLFDEEAAIGDDQPIEIVCYDKDEETGVLTPEDLDDRDWRYTAKNSHSDADSAALIVLNPSDITVDSDGNATLNPSNVKNRLTFWLPRANTSLMSAKNYVQDLQSTHKVSGRVFTKALGTLTMIGDATDRTS